MVVSNLNSIGTSSFTNSSGGSPFAQHLTGLANKYASDFDVDPGTMVATLSAILKLETGNQADFVPESASAIDKTNGDHGHGNSAWQVDDRHHAKMASRIKAGTVSFEEAGDYAIKHVLLPGFERAKEKGFSGVEALEAAARYYNGGEAGLQSDANTTDNYGERFVKAYNEYAPIYGGKPIPNTATASNSAGNSSSNLSPTQQEANFRQPDFSGNSSSQFAQPIGTG